MNYWTRELNWLHDQFGNRKAEHAGYLINVSNALPLHSIYSEHGVNATIRIEADTLSMMDIVKS